MLIDACPHSTRVRACTLLGSGESNAQIVSQLQFRVLLDMQTVISRFRGQTHSPRHIVNQLDRNSISLLGPLQNG